MAITSLDSINLIPTFRCVSIEVPFSGSVPSMGEVFYDRWAVPYWRRAGEATWHEGHPLVTRPDGSLVVLGSLVGLEPDTEYEVMVQAGALTVFGVFRTRSEDIPLGTGPIYHVSPSGDDTNPGTEVAPFKTIRKAASMLTAGITLIIHAGTYFEVVPITASGTPDNYITIMAAGDGPVILENSLPQYIVPNSLWTYYGPGVHGEQIWFIPNLWSPSLRWGENVSLLKYGADSATGNLDLLKANAWNVTGAWSKVPEEGRLYVFLPGGLDPNTQEIHLGTIGGTSSTILTLNNASYIRIKGLNLRIGANGTFRLINSHYPVIEDCDLWSGIRVPPGSTKGIIFRRNRIWVRSTYRDIHYKPGTPVAMLLHSNDGGHIIYENTFDGDYIWKDGIGGYDNDDLRDGPSRDTDIYDNHFRLFWDDPIESEGGQQNIRIWGNTIDQTGAYRGKGQGIAHAPVGLGPVYDFRNIIIKWGDAGEKLGGGKSRKSDGWHFIYHNTFYATIRPGGTGLAGFGNTQWFNNLVTRNNIFSLGYYFNQYWNQFPTNSLDYDLIWTTDPRGNGFVGKWADHVYLAFAPWQVASGQEPHGISADPLLGSDLAPLTGSPAIGRGVVIPGFNTEPPWQARGAPDMGAVETGGPVPAPIARLAASPLSGYAPLPVDFVDTSLGPIDSRLLAFGDGQTSTVTTGRHTYILPGTYTATLTVIGPGGSNSMSLVIQVVAALAPIASFTADQTQGVAPLAVKFTDTSQGAEAWGWDFGDGSPVDTRQHPIHTFVNPGPYTVTLTVGGPGGPPSSAQLTITVLAVPPPPVAAFTPTPREGPAPLTVQFTDTSEGAEAWSWDFGDGSPLDARQSPSHTYTAPGGYTVILTVSGPGGSDTESAGITVTEPAPPSVPVGKILAGAAIFATLVDWLRRR